MARRKKPPVQFRVACGAEVKRLRTNHRLTQTELAEMIDPPVDVTTISRWESGKDTFTIFQYLNICAKLGEEPTITPFWQAFQILIVGNDPSIRDEHGNIIVSASDCL